MIKKLALVEKVYLEYQERHILNVNCLVKYEDSGSLNMLNIVLDTWDKEKQKRVGTAEGMTFLIDLLNFFGVNNLTEVENKYVYVLVDDVDSWDGKAHGIEHLATNPNKQCGIKKMVFKDYFSSWEE